MKFFRIVEACSIKGQHVEPGQVVEVSDADALFLVDSGRGVPAEPVEPPPAADELAESDVAAQATAALAAEATGETVAETAAGDQAAATDTAAAAEPPQA